MLENIIWELETNIPFHSIDLYTHKSLFEKATPVLKLGLFGKEKRYIINKSRNVENWKDNKSGHLSIEMISPFEISYIVELICILSLFTAQFNKFRYWNTFLVLLKKQIKPPNVICLVRIQSLFKAKDRSWLIKHSEIEN